ncbi:MAG: 50S ribosomal protein L21 [Kiritimatiellia bacterium]|nr:50S ribosomal protein L21 [Kiritimatiellia bacterium]
MEAYAVIETGGKQYRVQKGDSLDVELLGAEAGSKVILDKVLALSDGKTLTVGVPLVAGAVVEAEVADLHRGPKLISFKKKRRKGYKKTIGHRQNLMKIKISDIRAG